MCVTIAVKLPRDKSTGLPTKDAKWRLAKIRDRIYTPIYNVKRYTVKKFGTAQLFLIDSETDWTEGVSVHKNGFFLGMVNSALNNTMDKKDGKEKEGGEYKETSNNGRIIRKALKSKSIEEASKIIVDNKIDGATLITDGDRLFVIETTLPLEIKEKYKDQKVNGEIRFEDIVPLEEYKSVVKEITSQWFVVRTNHGIFDKEFGYQPKDGDNYLSSLKRRQYVIDNIKSNVYEPLDLITTLTKLGRDDIDDEPYFRPVRKFDLKHQYGVDLPNIKTDPIYSTTIVQIDPSGTIIVKPLECVFDINNMNNLIDGEYLTHMVVLPYNSRMFETFNDYMDREQLKESLK